MGQIKIRGALKMAKKKRSEAAKLGWKRRREKTEKKRLKDVSLAQEFVDNIENYMKRIFKK